MIIHFPSHLMISSHKFTTIENLALENDTSPGIKEKIQISLLSNQIFFLLTKFYKSLRNDNQIARSQGNIVSVREVPNYTFSTWMPWYCSDRSEYLYNWQVDVGISWVLSEFFSTDNNRSKDRLVSSEEFIINNVVHILVYT